MAVKTKKKKCSNEAPVAAKGKIETCPQGYVWNGTKCVKDVG